MIGYCGILLLALKWSTALFFYRNWFRLFPPLFNVVLASVLCLSGLEAFGLGLSILGGVPVGFDAVVWGALYILTDVVVFGMAWVYLMLRYWLEIVGPEEDMSDDSDSSAS